ncbi:MAG: ATP-binding cassette domain-containing protein [Planctomycetaceae bacterium]
MKAMALLSLNNLTFTYSKPNLLDGITLHIERGERIGLVGRNGAGKSTLMKLIAGLLKPDDGSVDVQSEGVIARLDQEVPSGGDKTAFEMAAQGLVRCAVRSATIATLATSCTKASS